MRTNLPRAIRTLRVRNGWRQQDLGTRSGVSRQLVSRIERGQLSEVPLKIVERVVTSLGATTELRVFWHGEQLDRLMDARHAALQDSAARMLSNVGWVVRPEVSFNHFGDRGRVDLLAWQPATRLLLVVEVKSGLGDLQDTLARIDVKVRLGQILATEAGWGSASGVVPAIVIGDSAAARRSVRAHAWLFGRYAARGRDALSWVRRPHEPAPSGLLWFAGRADSRGVRVKSVARVRKRTESHVA